MFLLFGYLWHFLWTDAADINRITNGEKMSKNGHWDRQRETQTKTQTDTFTEKLTDMSARRQAAKKAPLSPPAAIVIIKAPSQRLSVIKEQRSNKCHQKQKNKHCFAVQRRPKRALTFTCYLSGYAGGDGWTEALVGGGFEGEEVCGSRV